MTLISHVSDDSDLSPGLGSEEGPGKSFKRSVWQDAPEASGARVGVWVAEPGRYSYPPRELEEVFVVLEGEAMCYLGDDEPQRIGPGSIVHIPHGAAAALKVLTPLRKVAAVVPKA